jgi:hypothetical protein
MTAFLATGMTALFFALWGRSVADLVSTLQELIVLNVGFVSLTEALDLTPPTGRAMAGLLAVFAEFEREILRERVRSGHSDKVLLPRFLPARAQSRTSERCCSGETHKSFAGSVVVGVGANIEREELRSKA